MLIRGSNGVLPYLRGTWLVFASYEIWSYFQPKSVINYQKNVNIDYSVEFRFIAQKHNFSAAIFLAVSFIFANAQPIDYIFQGIPYNVWANREPTLMWVWFPRTVNQFSLSSENSLKLKPTCLYGFANVCFQGFMLKKNGRY